MLANFAKAVRVGTLRMSPICPNITSRDRESACKLIPRRCNLLLDHSAMIIIIVIVKEIDGTLRADSRVAVGA